MNKLSRLNRVHCIILGALLSTQAIAQADPTVSDDQVSYYFGDVQYFSEDGKIPYGGTHSLIKRTTSPQKLNITEELIQPPRRQGQPAFQTVTTITRVDESNVLVATDDLHSFIGKMTFTGDNWMWTSWTYSLAFIGGGFSGGKLVGSGTLNSGGMTIEKKFYTQTGVTLVRENLKSISQNQFTACKATLIASQSPAATCDGM